MAGMSVNNKRILYLILIMFGTAALAAFLTINITYQAATEEEGERLREIAQSQARLIEAVARFDQKSNSLGDREASFNATLSQLIGSHERHKGFGETGEFTIAKLENNQIHFLLSHRHEDSRGMLTEHEPIPISDKLAEPMKMALQGKSGVMVGIDYRGKKVLAAYEPLDWTYATIGIVAKIDIVEIRKPFVRAGFITAICTIFIVTGGILLFRQISSPLVRNIEENEEKYRLLFESSNDAILIADAETGIIVNANPKAEIIFGRSLPEIIGAHHTTFYSTDKTTETEKSFHTAVEKEESISHDFEVHQPDGTIVPVDISSKVFKFDGKKLLMGSFRDVRERKRVEILVSRLGRLMDHASSEIYIFDAATHNFTQVNISARKNLGYTLDELKKISLIDIVIGCDEEKLNDRLQPLLTGSEEFTENSFTFSRVDGSSYPAEGRIQYSKEENPPVFVLIARDITEQKRAEEDLKESELRYRSITQSSYTAIVTADSSGKIVNWNPGAERIFGYTEQEALSKNLTELMPERYREAHKTGFDNSRAEGKSKIAGVPIQLEGLRKNSEEFPIEMTISFWETGDGLFFSGIIRDLTEKEAIKVQR